MSDAAKNAYFNLDGINKEELRQHRPQYRYATFSWLLGWHDNLQPS